MRRKRLHGITFLALLFPLGVMAETKLGVPGNFYLVTKSEVQFFVDGKRHNFHHGKTDLIPVSEGSVVAIKYKSRFVYDAAAFAFKYEDGSHWMPLARSKMKVLDPALDPAKVTAEMIEKSNAAPSQGRLDKSFGGWWTGHGLPWLAQGEWIGAPNKHAWSLYGFVITKDKIQPLAPTKKEEKQEDDALPQLISNAQLQGIVVIEGDQGVGSGFLAKVDGKLCVVTNLHVLGTNQRFKLQTLSGRDVRVDVKSLKAAVGADVALLGVAEGVEGEDEFVALDLATNILENTEIGNQVVVVGNRLGGGVATQTKGKIMGIGPSRVEVDAEFQAGNSGSPIFDLESSSVVGVASYTETVAAEHIETKKLKEGDLKAETRWFGYRIDNVKEWQALDWRNWRHQITAVESYRNTSIEGLRVLQGKLDETFKDEKIARMVRSFKLDRHRFGMNRRTGHLLYSVASHLKARKGDMDRIRFYDYFKSCPYWDTNVDQQSEFRDLVIKALVEVSKETPR